jgi:hypothetical protein
VRKMASVSAAKGADSVRFFLWWCQKGVAGFVQRTKVLNRVKACRRGREEDGKRVRRERYLICPLSNVLAGSKNIAKHVRHTYVLQQRKCMQEGP